MAGTETRNFRGYRVLLAVVSVLAVAAVVYLGWPFFSSFTDPERARRLVEDFGVWGPLVFIGMQTVQVLLAPIPGQVAGLVGGFLFGTFWGVVYTMIGAAIGFTLVFLLAKRFGRPLAERFVEPKTLDRFDDLAQRGGVLVLFLVFLLPAFPDDVISFVAGMTRIRLRTLVLVSLGGRFPGYLVLSATGNGVAFENVNLILVLVGATVLIFGLVFWNRAWLYEMAGSGDVRRFLRERWPLSRMVTVVLVLAVVAATVLLFIFATTSPQLQF